MTVDHNPCVLVVESDESLANQISLDLKESGYEAVIAHDAVIALQSQRDRTPDLIVIEEYQLQF